MERVAGNEICVVTLTASLHRGDGVAAGKDVLAIRVQQRKGGMNRRNLRGRLGFTLRKYALNPNQRDQQNACKHENEFCVGFDVLHGIILFLLEASAPDHWVAGITESFPVESSAFAVAVIT